MANKYNILKAISWYTIGNTLIRGVTFFVLPIFTSLMDTSDYGIFSVYLSYLTIFETLVLLGLSSTVKMAKYSSEIDFDKYIFTTLFVTTAFTIFCSIPVNIFLIFFKQLLSMDMVLWNCILFSSGTSAICSILCAKLVIEGKYKTYMIFSVMSTLLNVGISLLLCFTIFRNHDIYLSRVFGPIAANVFGVLFLLFKTKYNYEIDKKYILLSIKWGIPLMLHTVATVVLSQSDRIIIKYTNGYSEAGIYSVAVTFISIPLILQTSFESAWSPWFYEKLENKDYGVIRKVNDIYIICFGTIVGLFILVSPELVHIFTTKPYWDSAYSLAPLSISIFGEMLYCMPVNVEYFNKKTNYILSGTLLALVINIFLDIIMIKSFGFVGAAYATMLSKLILFLFHYYFSRRIDRNAIFHNRTAILSLIILLFVNFLTVSSVNSFIIRYAIIMAVIIVGVLLVKKHSVIQLFKDSFFSKSKGEQQ